jgi:hypothetical protein
MKSRRWQIGCAIVLAATLIACTSRRPEPPNDNPPPPNRSEEPGVPAVSSAPSSPADDTRDRYHGQARVVSVNGVGSDDYPTRHARCSNIDLDIQLGTYEANAWKWQTYVTTQVGIHQGTRIDTVLLDPAAGTVESGGSPVIHASGSYDGGSGATFYIHVASVYGSGENVLDFTCY